MSIRLSVFSYSEDARGAAQTAPVRGRGDDTWTRRLHSVAPGQYSTRSARVGSSLSPCEITYFCIARFHNCLIVDDCSLTW